MIKILVADDHAVVRAGLKRIIDDIPGMVVADEASSGQEVLEKAALAEKKIKGWTKTKKEKIISGEWNIS